MKPEESRFTPSFLTGFTPRSHLSRLRSIILVIRILQVSSLLSKGTVKTGCMVLNCGMRLHKNCGCCKMGFTLPGRQFRLSDIRHWVWDRPISEDVAEPSSCQGYAFITIPWILLRFVLPPVSNPSISPFFLLNAWQTTWEHAEKLLVLDFYDVAWAIQSLYCLDHDSLHSSLARLLGSLHSLQRTACTVLAKQEAFVSQVHHTFFQECSPPTLRRLTFSAEAVVAGLE